MVDLWVQDFGDAPAEETIADLVRVFGLEESQARRIVAAAPCIVKKNLTPDKAAPWVAALKKLGATVELRGEKVRVAPAVSLQVPRGKFDRKSLRPTGAASEHPPPMASDVIAYDAANVPPVEPDSTEQELFYEDDVDESEAAARARLDLSDSLELALDGPMVESDGGLPGRTNPLTPSAAPEIPDAADYGGLGDDPLAAPIPQGMLELDSIAPPKRPTPLPPPPADSAPEPGFNDYESTEGLFRLSEEETDTKSGGIGQAIGLVLLGIGILATRLTIGVSCFLGTSSIPMLGFDAIGLTLLVTGVMGIVSYARDGVRAPVAPIVVGGVLLVCSAAVVGLNVLMTPTPERQADIEQAEQDDDTEDMIEDGLLTEARASLSVAPDPQIQRLVENIYVSGAPTVYRQGPKLIIEMPPTEAARGAIVRTYRRFLGIRLETVGAGARPHPLARYWHITVQF